MVKKATRTTKRKKTNENVNTQLSQVRKDLAAVAATLGSVGSEKLRSAKSKADGMLKDANKRGGVVSKAKRTYKDVESKTIKFVHKRPLLSIILAFVIGFFFAKCW